MHNDKRCLLNKLEKASETMYSCQQPAVNVFFTVCVCEGAMDLLQWREVTGATGPGPVL